MKVIKQIVGMMAKNTKVYYVTGNHDEMLRKFEGLQMGNFEICNKLELELDEKKAWIFHGDVFDVIMQHSKWLAKLGAIGYDSLIYINTFVNFISSKLGRGKIALSKKVKENVKSALKYIDDFEQSAADLAIRKGFDYIICGHIHKAQIRTIENTHGNILYLNSGDWIESLTALEYKKGKWELYHHIIDPPAKNGEAKLEDDSELTMVDFDNKELFNKMLEGFKK
jgi:UDP-2,3-diacylglucosamine pyrophosphatase LpxH